MSVFNTNLPTKPSSPLPHTQPCMTSWWSGGHSDSLDPDSFKEEKLHPHGSSSSGGGGDIEDEGTTTTTTTNSNNNKGSTEKEEADEHEEAHEWDYIRVNGLGFVPGLCCPHHDRVQSNGILRATDFDAMMHRHPTEVGICIDHNAAFLINHDIYRVLTPIPNENELPFPGSVADDGSFSADRLGSPGVWIKEMVDCGQVVKCWQCPAYGKVNDLLKVPESINVSIRHMNRAALGTSRVYGGYGTGK
jgi:dipeptidase E